VVDEQFGCLTSDDRSGAAAVENEAGYELWTEDAHFADELQHLAGRPAVERRRPRRDQHQVSGEQGGTHQYGNARLPIDDDVTSVSGELGRFAVQRVASKADAAEESRQTLLGALLRPIERRSLWVGVDQRDALALPRSDAFGADGGTRTRTLREKQIFLPLRLSPPPVGVRGLDCPFAMASRPKAPPVQSLHLPSIEGLARDWPGARAR
jgi:hypothetical protein